MREQRLVIVSTRGTVVGIREPSGRVKEGKSSHPYAVAHSLGGIRALHADAEL